MVSARKHLKKWVRWARSFKLNPVTKVADMIHEKIEYIINYCRHGITNGPAEGMNSQIMSIQRHARGYRHFKTFRMAIMFFFGGLNLSPNAKS